MTELELAHPHDLLVRHFLVEPDLTADLLTHYVDPKIVGLLDLGRLRYESPVNVDKNLDELIGDLRFSTTFRQSDKPSDVFVFFEHQSKQDRMIPFRLLEYVVKSYRKHLDAGDGIRSFPYPVAVVLYHGKRPWTKLLSMADLIDSVPGVDTNILNIPIHLIDLATIPLGKLKGHPAIRALLEALQSASEGKLEERFDHVVDLLTAAKDDPRVYAWLSAIIRYIMSLCRPARAKETVFKAYRKLLDEEEARKMATSWVEELLCEGKTEGEAKGKAEGIITVLEARFDHAPKSVQDAVNACTDPSKLDALTRLAATCASIDEFRQGVK